MSEVDLLEHLNLRELPALDPIEPPERLSQTLLRHFDNCQRSAYLYVVHHGGLPGTQLDRGSALHLAIARATNTMLVEGEPTMPPDVAKVILDEVLDEHHEFTIPIAEQDDLREMMYHWSQSTTINPAAVVAVERKFVLELEGHTLSGIIDYAEINEQAATIRDYKSTWALPTEAEYEASFQGRFYSVLLTFGNPVTETRCPDCTFDDDYGREPLVHCSESCTGKRVALDPPLGDRLTWVDVGELFPRYLHDGSLALRNVGMTRLEVEEARRDIARLVRRFAEAADSGKWPAMSGSHCSECPMEARCPLPRELRSFAGAINTPDQAAEAAAWHERWNARLAATRKELRLFAKLNGPIRFGRDREWVFVPQETNVTDWEQLDQAIESARQYGTPFNASDYRRTRVGTRFVARTVGREGENEEPE
jgi:hypothetical protein